MVPATMEPATMDTLGSILFGTLLGCVLFGSLLHQTARYYKTYAQDIWLFRVLVPLLVVLEVCYTGLNVDASYYYLVTARLNEADLLTGRLSLKVLNLFGVSTTLLCQCFYARRIYLFGSRHRIVLLIAAFFTLVGLAFFMLVSAIEFRSASILDIAGHSWMFSVSYGCSVVADILLSGILVYALLRSRTGAKSTNSVVHTVIVYTINTGAATSIIGIVVFALGLVWRDRLTWVGPSLISPKLYANSVLAVLNSRRSLSNRILDGPSELISVESELHFRTIACSSGGVQPELHEMPTLDEAHSALRVLSCVGRGGVCA